MEVLKPVELIPYRTDIKKENHITAIVANIPIINFISPMAHHLRSLPFLRLLLLLLLRSKTSLHSKTWTRRSLALSSLYSYFTFSFCSPKPPLNFVKCALNDNTLIHLLTHVNDLWHYYYYTLGSNFLLPSNC